MVGAKQQALADGLAGRSLGGMKKAYENQQNWVELSNQGATRNLPITEQLQKNINSALQSVYGEGYKAKVYSGGQPEIGTSNRRVGSTRHDGGNAADVYIYDPQGNRLTGDALAPLAKHWVGNRLGGVGLEMRGGGIHLDTHVDKAPYWTYGAITSAQQAAIDEGLKMRGGNAPLPAIMTAQAAPAPASQASSYAPMSSAFTPTATMQGQMASVPQQQATIPPSLTPPQQTDAAGNPIYYQGELTDPSRTYQSIANYATAPQPKNALAELLRGAT